MMDSQVADQRSSLTMTWVHVTDAHGRTRLESRWLSADSVFSTPYAA